MKKLFTFAKILGSVAMVYVIAACSSTPAEGGGSVSAQKEALLAQSGFKAKTVTTAKQQQRLAQLPLNQVSAVKYNGQLYYVYPTEAKNSILVGKQAQFNSYKQALQTKAASRQATLASQTAQEQQQIMNGDPEWSGTTAGPRHILVQQYDGFGPLDPMQGD